MTSTMLGSCAMNELSWKQHNSLGPVLQPQHNGSTAHNPVLSLRPRNIAVIPEKKKHNASRACKQDRFSFPIAAATATRSAETTSGLESLALEDRTGTSTEERGAAQGEQATAQSASGGYTGRRSLGGGLGGRRWVRSARPVVDEFSTGGESDGDTSDSEETRGTHGDTPKLAWLSQSASDLASEKTIWRVNRTISRCGSVKEALAVVEEMKAVGLNAANEGTYVALITVCRRQKQADRALVVYEAMKQAAVRPGMLTFNTLIGCCQQAQRLEDAFRLKREMEECGLKPDVVSYTSLMALVVNTGPYRGRSSPAQRFARAMVLFEEMQQRGVPADAITFNTLLYAGAQAKLPGKVLEVYGKMVASGVLPNHFTFGILLEAVGHGGRLKAALQVFNEMKAAGIQPSTSTYNFLIEACGIAPQPDAAQAWALFEELNGSKGKAGLRPNAETLNHLITTCCKAGDSDRALRAFDMMRARKFTRAVTVSTYNKLIHCAASTGRTEKAFELFSQMREEGRRPDVITFGTLINACTADSDVPRAVTAWQEMESLGIRPNQAAHHALMGLYGKAGEWRKSVEVYTHLQTHCKDECATLATYTVLFDALLGPKGAEASMGEAAQSGSQLRLTPALSCALELFQEGVDAGALKRTTKVEDMSRCDLRNLTRPVAVVAILDWLLRVTASGLHMVPSQELILVTSAIAKSQTVGEPRGRFPKQYMCAKATLEALGLEGRALRTLTLQALVLKGEQLLNWSLQQESDACAASV